jgi:hypothetical protein
VGRPGDKIKKNKRKVAERKDVVLACITEDYKP